MLKAQWLLHISQEEVAELQREFDQFAASGEPPVLPLEGHLLHCVEYQSAVWQPFDGPPVDLMQDEHFQAGMKMHTPVVQEAEFTERK